MFNTFGLRRRTCAVASSHVLLRFEGDFKILTDDQRCGAAIVTAQSSLRVKSVVLGALADARFTPNSDRESGHQMAFSRGQWRAAFPPRLNRAP
jgi:hypothetical protein